MIFMKTSIQSFTNKVAAASITSLVYVSTAFAQTDGNFAGPDPELPGLPGAADDESVRTIITDILTAVLNFLALIAVVVVVIAGIRLIVSQGEDEAKDKAKKTIFYALGGLVIVLFARVIVSLVTVYLAGQVEGTN